VAFGGTSLSAKVGELALPTNGSTTSATVGFQTNALFCGAAFGAFPSSLATMFFSEGLCSYDGTTIRQAAKATRFITGGGSSTYATVRDSDIGYYSAASRPFNVSAISSTQFTVSNTSGSNLSSFSIGYLALNFGGEAAAWVGVLDSPTTTGNHDFTGSSFTPKLAYFMPTTENAVDTEYTDGTGAGWAVSAVTANTEHASFWRKRDAASGATSIASDNAINLEDHTSTSYHDGTFVSMLSNGVRVNLTTANGTARKWPFMFIG
jgi:hypothetical protein